MGILCSWFSRLTQCSRGKPGNGIFVSLLGLGVRVSAPFFFVYAFRSLRVSPYWKSRKPFHLLPRCNIILTYVNAWSWKVQFFLDLVAQRAAQ